jgi:hypothetical protein
VDFHVEIEGAEAGRRLRIAEVGDAISKDAEFDRVGDSVPKEVGSDVSLGFCRSALNSVTGANSR